MSRYSDTIIADHPFAYYRLGESSGTQAFDLSGNNYTATINSSGITEGVTGAINGDTDTAMLFDGSAGYIALPAGVKTDGWTALSIEMWINLANNSFSQSPRLLANDHTDADNNGFQLAIGAGGINGFLSIGIGTTQGGANFSQTFTSGLWYHLVGTYDGNTIRVYVNGRAQGTLSLSGSIATAGYPLNIGRNPAYGGDYFPGTIDEVAIYHSTLTPAQIITHYQASALANLSPYASAIQLDGPQAYYRLNEGSGAIAYDATGNGYHATIRGSYTRSRPGAIAGDMDTSTLLTGSATLQLPPALDYTTWSALSLEFWIDVNHAWQHVVVTSDKTTTLVYLNGNVYAPAMSAASALIRISRIFDFAGSTQACDLDEIAVYNYVLSPAQVSNHFMLGTTATASPGAPGGVRLLINDVHYPTIRQETINIDRTANDPIPSFRFTLQDDPSNIALSELQEVVFIDAGLIPYPTHNLLQNPLLSPYNVNWSASTTGAGGTFTSLAPGVQMTPSGGPVDTMGLSQITQNGLVVPNQSYVFSCYVDTSTLHYASATLGITFLSAMGAALSAQSTLVVGGLANARYTVSGTAPTGTTSIAVSIGVTAAFGIGITVSGSAIFTSAQLEPMSFATGITQLGYPTPFCAVGQANCTLMPDNTTIRQYRLFGGYITKATAGDYIGNNRKWSVQVSGYAWLFGKQLLNDSFTNKTDSYIINNLVAKYFPKQFSTAGVATGATIDAFGYTYNGMMRDAIDALSGNSGYYPYVDAYRTIIYQPPGYNQLGFMLSDQPDNMTSFPYYNYSRDIDGTQLGNACLVTGATGISAVEYDAQSIAYYNQKTNGQGIFWRTVNDSTITSNAAARQRAIAEITQYNYARPIVHLSTNQLMIPGYTVLFSSRTDQLTDVPFLVQKSTLVLQGFRSLQVAQYECQCDLGAWNPDGINITVRLLRKQLTNASNIGTPGVGLMVTEDTTFVDSVVVTPITSSPATYGMGIYGVSTYAASIPGIPTTQYGRGTYGNPLAGYN